MSEEQTQTVAVLRKVTLLVVLKLNVDFTLCTLSLKTSMQLRSTLTWLLNAPLPCMKVTAFQASPQLMFFTT